VAGPRRAVHHLLGERRSVSDEDAGLLVYEQIWRAAAVDVGAQVHDLGSGFLEIARAGRKIRVRRNLVALDDPVTLRLVGDKPVVHRLLSAAGLPVPEYLAFDRRELSPALEFLEQDPPCVVKPAFATGRGRGVTCGVESPNDLRRAAAWAARWGRELLVERQGQGEEYRVLVLEGEVLDVLRRRPPRVTGDGRSTIAELIEAENGRRAASGGGNGMFPIDIDLDCLLTLRSEGLSLDSVPARDATVAVKRAANENGPQENESVADAAGAGFRDEMRFAATALGVRLASIEVIAPGIHEPLGGCGGTIIEVNTTPGLHYHYRPSDAPGGGMDSRTAVPVAVSIVTRLLRLGDD
jgi:D-alanine-D-alanine ligase-like ATP-grasp enzyme